MKRLGIYGGTFAPVHKGHIESAKAFLDSSLIDELRIIPTAISPHKKMQCNDNPDDRLNMLRIAFSELEEKYRERLIIDPYEILRGGKSYTVLTVEHYLSEYSSITLLCGTDMFLTLESWYHGEELLRMCSFAYDARDVGEDTALAEKAEYYAGKYGTRCTPLRKGITRISSTELRGMIGRGEETEKYLPQKVREYIDEHGLYRA